MRPHEGDLRRLLVLVALTTSVAVSIGHALPPRFHAWVLGLGAAWATAQSDLSWRVEQYMARRGWSRQGQRIAELAIMFVVAKLLHLAWLGWAGAVDEMAAWPIGFLELETFLTWLLMVSMWVGVSLTLNDLAGLGGRGDPLAETGLPVPNLIRRWVFGGVVLVVAASIGLAGWSELISLRRAPLVGLLVPGLVYFPVGVAALSHVRLADISAHWARDRAAIDADVARRWSAAALVAALAVVLGLLVIPTGDAKPLFAVIGAVLAAAGRAFAAIVQWLSNRDGPEPTPGDTATGLPELPEPIGDPNPLPIQPGETLFSEEVTRILQRGLFWVLLVAVVLLIGRELHRSRHQLGAIIKEGFEGRGLLGGIWAAIRAVPGILWGAVIGLFDLFSRRPAAEASPTPSSGAGGTSTWSSADPARGRVVALYRRFLALTGAHIGGRAPSETPGEYQRRIDEGLSVVSEPAASVTALFEEARYSGRPVGEDRLALTSDEVAEIEQILTPAEDEPPAGSSGSG